MQTENSVRFCATLEEFFCYWPKFNYLNFISQFEAGPVLRLFLINEHFLVQCSHKDSFYKNMKCCLTC